VNIDPVTYEAVPNSEPVNEVATTFVFTCSPFCSDMEADTEPDDIWDKFKPVIPDAGISNKLAPDPENDPVIPWVTISDPVTCVLLLIETIVPLSVILLI